MGFSADNLHREEQIVLDLHPHWIMLAKGVSLLVLAIVLGGWVMWGLQPEGTLGSFATGASAVLIIAALLYFLQRWIAWVSTNFVVTTDRCIYREGIISKRGIEIPLERINTVFFNQGIIDRLVKAGTLTIESAGEHGVQTFEDVRNPIGVQQELYQQMEDNENRKFDRVRAPAAQLSVADEIAKLAALRDQGHLSDAEFEAHKASLLSQGQPPAQPPT
ncbi:MAG: PH domain-containing protein [Microthrixaceae bacterium]